MKSNRFANNDEGVSAVIGVILMVAITVILAAVIAAFVFGMVGGVKKTYTIAVTSQRTDSNNIIVTFNGGPDNIHCTGLEVTSTGSTATPATDGITNQYLNSAATEAAAKPIVGNTAKITGTAGTPPANLQDTVTVVATWDDGSQTTVLSQTL